MSLGLHPMDLKKREFPWSGRIPGNVSGQAFKTEGNGANMTLLFKDNIVKLVQPPSVASEMLNFLPARAQLDPASGGNLFIWLGGSPAGLKMEIIDGVRVPAAFALDRKVWRVTDDPMAWTRARAAWIEKYQH